MTKYNVRRSIKLNSAEGDAKAPDPKKEVQQTNHTLWIIAAVTLAVGVYIYLKRKK